jgi:hypothetical protein
MGIGNEAWRDVDEVGAAGATRRLGDVWLDWRNTSSAHLARGGTRCRALAACQAAAMGMGNEAWRDGDEVGAAGATRRLGDVWLGWRNTSSAHLARGGTRCGTLVA